MKRPGLAFLILFLSIVIMPLVAGAQQAEKVHRIGLLRADGPVSTLAGFVPCLSGGAP
jgi:hypothetical protein